MNGWLQVGLAVGSVATIAAVAAYIGNDNKFDREHPCMRSHYEQSIILVPHNCGNGCMMVLPQFMTIKVCDERSGIPKGRK